MLLANSAESQFVVDDKWTTDHTAPQETDLNGNTNNILKPSDITPSAAANILSTVTPAATTVALAGAMPKESDKRETPGGSAEAPGAESQTFSVQPIPATSGIGNPIHPEPGEKVPDPSELTTNTVESTAKTDEASYEKSDAAVTTGNEPKPTETAMDPFGVPPVTSNIIPESSLPIGTSTGGSAEPDPGVTIQSVAPTSTTAALAAAVPKEEPPATVPEVVKESEREANASPEAAANPEAVQEKSQVEQELQSKVPEEPPTSIGTGTGTAEAAKEPEAPSQAPNATETPHETATTAEVPAVVTESITKAHEPAEAVANPEAVREKEQVEQELESKVKPVEAAGEPAPTVTAETSAVAPGDTAPVSGAEEPAKSGDVSSTTPAAATSGPVEVKGEVGAAKKADAAPTADKSEKKKKRFSFFKKLFK